MTVCFTNIVKLGKINQYNIVIELMPKTNPEISSDNNNNIIITDN